MAQSRPFLGRLEPFYGWYKRVIGKQNSDTKLELIIYATKR